MSQLFFTNNQLFSLNDTYVEIPCRCCYIQHASAILQKTQVKIPVLYKQCLNHENKISRPHYDVRLHTLLIVEIK